MRSTASWLGGRLGYSDQLLGEVLAAAPRLLAGDPEAMEERLAWLDEQLGIGEVGRLQRVVRLAPLVLLLSLEKTLRPRVAFVRALGVDDTLLANLIVRSPRLLHSPEAALAARVDWLTDNKIVEKAGGGIAAFLARQPDFFALSPAQCAKRLDTLEALGLSRAGRQTTRGRRHVVKFHGPRHEEDWAAALDGKVLPRLDGSGCARLAFVDWSD